MRAIELECAVYENLFRQGVYAERVAVPDHHIRSLAGLERPNAVIKTQRFCRIGGEPADGPLRSHSEARALTVRHRLRGLLIQTLDAVGRIRVDDGATVFLEVHH